MYVLCCCRHGEIKFSIQRSGKDEDNGKFSCVISSLFSCETGCTLCCVAFVALVAYLMESRHN